jgi:hypothetical protein
MKKTLRKMLLAGVFLAASLNINAQIGYSPLASKQEIKKELGSENSVSLGYGYVTLKDSGKENYLDKTRLIEGINRGSIELIDNGINQEVNGPLTGVPSKKTLEEIDFIKKDYIITPEEISKTLDKKCKESFLKYASKILDVPKEQIIELEEGYVTSKKLKGKLDELSKMYEEKFYNHPKTDLYKIMSEKDKVISPREIETIEIVIKEF